MLTPIEGIRDGSWLQAHLLQAGGSTSSVGVIGGYRIVDRKYKGREHTYLAAGFLFRPVNCFRNSPWVRSANAFTACLKEAVPRAKASLPASTRFFVVEKAASWRA